MGPLRMYVVSRGAQECTLWTHIVGYVASCRSIVVFVVRVLHVTIIVIMVTTTVRAGVSIILST